MTSEKKVWPLGTNHTDSEGTPWKGKELVKTGLRHI